jgi:GGDEF domain-containing protein
MGSNGHDPRRGGWVWADRLRVNPRTTGVAARFGDDEFAVLLQGVGVG